MKKNKGFAPLLIVILIAALAAGGTYYVVSKKKSCTPNQLCKSPSDDLATHASSTNVIEKNRSSSTTIQTKSDIQGETKTPTIKVIPKIIIKSPALGLKYPIGYPVKIEWTSDASIKKFLITKKNDQHSSSQTIVATSTTGQYSSIVGFESLGNNIITISDSDNPTINASISIEVFNQCDKEHRGSIFNGQKLSCYQ